MRAITKSDPKPAVGPAAELFGWPMMELTGLWLATAAIPGVAFGQSTDEQAPRRTAPATSVEGVLVKGRADVNPPGLAKLPDTIQNSPQSIDVVTSAQIAQQAVTSLQDALRYAPGITLNSGEGGAHGDNINLRGFHAIDGFFLDGIRDPGSYTRDSFDLQSLEVLEGPASVLFGNGPSGGVVNQTSKQPSLAPLNVAKFETGTNDEARATLDVNQPIGPNAAFRINLMGETTNVTDRDYVRQRRWGAAPSLALGIGQSTRLTLSYFHQQEDNIPDYGIPFLFGAPAPVKRSLYYGLRNYDTTTTDVNIVGAVLQHDFSDALSITNTFRYANYGSNYRVSAPIFGDDFTGGPPGPGTPLNQVLIYRDRPSSEGTQTYLTDHTDLAAQFAIGPFGHTLITGFEVGRQTTDYVRFDNAFEGVDGVAPTLLLAPDANETAPDQHTVDARPDTTSDNIGVYVTDQIRITPLVNLDLGVRYDRYDTHFNDSVAVASFHRVDDSWSPKIALVFKPDETKTFYASYTTSFDPAVSYLTLAADATGPAPQTARTYEVGAKARWFGGQLSSTIAIFQIDSANVTVSDPDDPTLQEIPGSDQRVRGVELTTGGHLTRQVEVNANYTYIEPLVSAATDPDEVGKQIPGAARNTANLFVTYEPEEAWQFGVGLNYVDRRYADVLNTASVPSYVLVNGLVSYQVTPAIRLQLNAQNLADVRYFTGAYYSDDNENHVLPGQGRVFTVSTTVRF